MLCFKVSYLCLVTFHPEFAWLNITLMWKQLIQCSILSLLLDKSDQTKEDVGYLSENGLEKPVTVHGVLRVWQLLSLMVSNDFVLISLRLFWCLTHSLSLTWKTVLTVLVQLHLSSSGQYRAPARYMEQTDWGRHKSSGEIVGDPSFYPVAGSQPWLTSSCLNLESWVSQVSAFGRVPI